jgi:uncharacterized membrane protein
VARWYDNLGSWFAPWRFLLFGAILIAATVVGRLLWPWGQAIMVGFDLAAITFFIVCVGLLNDTPAGMRKAAADNDANRPAMLVISAAVSAVILVTIGVELAAKPKGIDMALAVATLALGWLFSNVVYALHYAHLYDSRIGGQRSEAGGIEFHGTGDPDYYDFLYFALTLGMTFQTSDTDITSRHIRRVTIPHCVAAFIFNLGVLAFTINVLGSG